MTGFDLDDLLGRTTFRSFELPIGSPDQDEAWLARFEKVRAHRRIYVDEYLSVPSRRHSGEVARIWLVGADFGYGYISYESLASTSTCSDDFGESPAWLDQVVSDDGWGCVIGSHCDEHAAFLIEHGVAPGQPFRVEVTMSVSRSGWEYVEYDVEFDAVVVEVARWSPERVLAAWERWARTYLEPAR